VPDRRHGAPSQRIAEGEAERGKVQIDDVRPTIAADMRPPWPRAASALWLGAKVIDRLARDLSQAFPDMRGLSPRDLEYMRAFAAAWPDRTIVQEALAQITWYHNLALLEKLDRSEV
jgi:hypothetical protein